MLKYCTDTISMGPFEKTNKQTKTTDNIDDRWCILVSASQVSPVETKENKLLFGHFLILRHKADNCNNAVLTSQDRKKLSQLIFFIELSYSFPGKVSTDEGLRLLSEEILSSSWICSNNLSKGWIEIRRWLYFIIGDI